MANEFSHTLVKRPKRGRYDFSHSRKQGLRFGGLYPTLTEFIVPDDDVSISMAQVVRLAPMPLPTFMDMKIRHDFFFVPLRLLYGAEELDNLFGYAGKRACLSDTYFVANFISDGAGSNTRAPFFQGSLFDCLGYCPPTQLSEFDPSNSITPIIQQAISALVSSTAGPSDVSNYNLAFSDYYAELTSSGPLLGNDELNIEKLFAYHFIWRDWYRFTGMNPGNADPEQYLKNGVLTAVLPHYLNGDISFPADPWLNQTYLLSYLGNPSLPFSNAVLTDFKYAHLQKDMFTSVRYGNKPQVLIPANNGTIPQLRQASAVQRFVDLLSITGKRYYDNILGIFGVRPDGPADDRVQFLARYTQYIKSGEVLTTATTAQASTGDYAGRGILIDAKNYIFKRHFTEHGWLFCITSIVPEIDYRGLRRDLTDNSVYDIPNPPLAQVGDQSVLERETFFDWTFPKNGSIGDQFRYYNYKSHPNEVCGDFLNPTLSPFTAIPYAGSSFNLIPSTNIIDLSRVTPSAYNFIFNDVSNPYIGGDRFFCKFTFEEWITRSLPKYINYHL